MKKSFDSKTKNWIYKFKGRSDVAVSKKLVDFLKEKCGIDGAEREIKASSLPFPDVTIELMACKGYKMPTNYNKK